MDSILKSSVSTMLYVIIQHNEVLSMQDLTSIYIKATYDLHLNSLSSNDLC
jgi:hypothetical protein